MRPPRLKASSVPQGPTRCWAAPRMTRWGMSPGVAAVLAGAFGFVYVYLAGGAIENDPFIMLARAHQVLFGDWPVRDFEDPGMPLAYLVSSLAAAIFGPTLLVNVILS